MRGLFSIVFSPPPDESRFKTGLMILSCTERHAVAIRRFAEERYPHISWTILYRYDSSGVFHDSAVMFSSEAVTIRKKLDLLLKIRRSRYDVVYTAWTNEESFGLLKALSLLTNFRYNRVFNENIDAFYLHRSNFSNWRRHLLWRWASHSELRYVAANLLSWLFLFPLGLLYLLVRVVFLLSRRLAAAGPLQRTAGSREANTPSSTQGPAGKGRSSFSQ